MAEAHEPDTVDTAVSADTVGTEDSVDAATAAHSGSSGLRGQRVPLLIIAAIGLLVLGFAGGVWFGPHSSEGAHPSAVDIGFGQDMSTHHEQAVEMSAVALFRSTDPEIRGLAYDILTTQQGQIGRMQAWLQSWGAPGRAPGEHMTWMPDAAHDAPAGHEHGAMTSTMPGMASAAEMDRLRGAEGTALDVLFLQLMLRHHQGGISMLQYGADHAETSEMSTLAGQMLSAQRAESDLITALLRKRGAEPLPQN